MAPHSHRGLARVLALATLGATATSAHRVTLRLVPDGATDDGASPAYAYEVLPYVEPAMSAAAIVREHHSRLAPHHGATFRGCTGIDTACLEAAVAAAIALRRTEVLAGGSSAASGGQSGGLDEAIITLPFNTEDGGRMELVVERGDTPASAARRFCAASAPGQAMCGPIAEALAARALADHGFHFTDDGSRAPVLIVGDGVGGGGSSGVGARGGGASGADAAVEASGAQELQHGSPHARPSAEAAAVAVAASGLRGGASQLAHRPRLQWLKQQGVGPAGGCPARVLDVGACFGGWTRLLKEVCPRSSVTMVEANPARLPQLADTADFLNAGCSGAGNAGGSGAGDGDGGDGGDGGGGGSCGGGAGTVVVGPAVLLGAADDAEGVAFYQTTLASGGTGDSLFKERSNLCVNIQVKARSHMLLVQGHP